MSTSNEKPTHSEAELRPTATHFPIEEKMAAEEDDERKSLEGLSVLLVEDQYIMRAIGIKMLKALGATVTAADNGVRAVQAITSMLSAEKARKQAQSNGQEGSSSQCPHYDLILMDCNMPIMDGYEATREIRKLESEAKDKDGILIIAFTSNAPDNGQKECLAAGMDAFMQKPVEEAVMVSSILAALSNKRNKVNKVASEGREERLGHLSEGSSNQSLFSTK